MSDNTPRLGLPELVAGQAQMSVTHNEALAQIDALCDLFLKGKFIDTPPGTPADGDTYLIGGAPTGAWSGYAYKIAYCLDGGWRFYTPFDGLRAFVATSGALIFYAGGSWTDWAPPLSAGEVALASAATCDIGAAAALCVAITGTTAITGFGSGANALRFVRFAGALTLTHNATSLFLLGGANRITAAGDVGVYASDGSGNWRERAYSRVATDPGDASTKTGAETLTNKTLGATAIPGSGFIDSGGNIGIGTAALNAPLQIGTCNSGLATNGAAILIAKGAGLSGPESVGGIEMPSVIGGPGYGTKLYVDNSTDSFGIATRYNSAAWAGHRLTVHETDGGIGIGCVARAGDGLAVATGDITPYTDESINLGSASRRFGTVFAGTGTINTSGADTKTGTRALNDAEADVAKSLASNTRIYQFCTAVTQKGADVARWHIGLIYEDVVAAFAAQGLDPMRYGIVCRDPAMKETTTTSDEGKIIVTATPDLNADGTPKYICGLRYAELAQFLMAGLAARLTALEAK